MVHVGRCASVGLAPLGLNDKRNYFDDYLDGNHNDFLR